MRNPATRATQLVLLALSLGLSACAGLGLDIVRDLVQTYGGSIQAQPSPLGGLRMQLQLPGTRHQD